MPGYIQVYKYTQKGLANIKGASERAKQTQGALAKLGVRTIGLWWTLGEYDGIGVFEAPDDQAIAAASLAMASQRIITIQTLRAFGEEEFAKVVGKLP